MNEWDASEVEICEVPAESHARRRLSLFAKALIVTGTVAILIAAYVAVIWFPAANRVRLENDLRRFALLYHEYYATHRRAPSSLADLESFTPDDTVGVNSPEMYHAPRAFEMIRSGRFVVIWDAVFFSDGDENDKYVLGYEANAPERGGLVMRAGGSVRQMTAEEFSALPRIETTKAD